MKRDDIQLHGIIVTHPDSDHLSGIKRLLEKHGQNIRVCDIVLTEAFKWRSTHRTCTEFIRLINNMCYCPFPARGSFGELTPGLKCYFPTESGWLLRCTPNVRCIQPSEIFIKEKPKGIDTNETSILTTINESERKCDAVLTGDSRADLILPLVEGKEIGIFQVPHHGSSSNSRLKNRHKLTEYSTQHTYELSKIYDEVKEIFLFYCTFRAKCYLISAGGTQNYNHPHSPVLQGIILANAFQRQKCVILLTNSCGLHSEKLKELHNIVPKWTRYVKFFHLNDIFPNSIQRYTSLCIRNINTFNVEWTPEKYIHIIIEMIVSKNQDLVACRPLEKKRFTERSTVEINIQGTSITFSAHVICVPLPHNPRSGDRINCCYVIEESMRLGLGYRVDFSQVLFLQLDNDKWIRIRPLSRAQNYILFQYINNEWKQKQLYVRVRDSSPQSSPCNIPYRNINSLWPVCYICNNIIRLSTRTVFCCYRGCLSQAHILCAGFREYACPHHTCCLCKEDIILDFGTVSCNRWPQGCPYRAHAPCAGYTLRGASRVKRFSCPSCR